MSDTDYRARIYGAYVRSHRDLAQRTTLADFAPRLPYLSQVVGRHFPAARDARILELGCGPGALIHAAREAGYVNVAGVDRSPEQVATARRLGIAGVEEGDLLKCLAQTEPGSHDALVAFDVIEHFTKPEILAFVDLAHRALKPGGRFIVHTCNAESPFFGASFHGDLTHEVAFTRDSIGQLFLASGWSAVACHEDRPVPHGVKSAVRFALWHVLRAGMRLYRGVERGELGADAIFSQELLAVAVK